MGKTYVALGALALLRHFNPRCRVLIIAPRENIQRKWIKDYRNFINYNVRYPDLRVKNLDGRPVRRLAFCEDVIHLLRQSALDPDADFFCRLTSFSIAVSGKGALQSESIKGLRDSLRAELPWLGDEVFDLRSKQAFKDNFARALCCGLPTFDLVIIDEGAQPQAWLRRAAPRATGCWRSLWGATPARRIKGYFRAMACGRKRVLFLSATPVEETYRQLWNQLDVVRAGKDFDAFLEDAVTRTSKKALAARFLVRRVTRSASADRISPRTFIGGEWRRGGFACPDEPIRQGPGQKLIVALVQKKVSELQDERFNRRSRSACWHRSKASSRPQRSSGEESRHFDDAEQTEDALEREGIDVSAVNRLAASYRRRFGRELPHPKMDALVESLARLGHRQQDAGLCSPRRLREGA